MSPEMPQAKDEGKVKDTGMEVAVSEEKSAAEGDSKITILKNYLSKMFSRESGDAEVAARSSTNKEGIEDQSCEGAGDGAKKEESLNEKTKEKNLKKRPSFRAIKSSFAKEKKEEAAATPEEGKEETRAEGEAKNETGEPGDHQHKEAIKTVETREAGARE